MVTSTFVNRVSADLARMGDLALSSSRQKKHRVSHGIEHPCLALRCRRDDDRLHHLVLLLCYFWGPLLEARLQGLEAHAGIPPHRLLSRLLREGQGGGDGSSSGRRSCRGSQRGDGCSGGGGRGRGRRGLFYFFNFFNWSLSWRWGWDLELLAGTLLERRPGRFGGLQGGHLVGQLLLQARRFGGRTSRGCLLQARRLGDGGWSWGSGRLWDRENRRELSHSRLTATLLQGSRGRFGGLQGGHLVGQLLL
mmetsp:Transcript_20068/g.43704  ORF Transcript_20068/g.43704 Transcript_20068/m.43704 type:complete len:250 (+) Transcript_20068:646-1395(+)